MADRLRLLLAVLLLPAAGALAQAARPDAGLPDPTRPPSASDVALASGGDPAAAPPPQLSSVVIPARGKPRAVIDGQNLGLGDAVGDAKIVRIAEAGVSLKGPQGTQFLPLTPGIEKKMLRSAPDQGRTGKKTP